MKLALVKKKWKFYTKREIKEARAANNIGLLHELAQKLMGGEHLSINEAEEAATIVGASRREGEISKVDLATVRGAQDYRFVRLFLAYYGDLDGRYGILKFNYEPGNLVTRLVSREEKAEDVIRLNEYYDEWNAHFRKNNHKDQLLNLIINEFNKVDLAILNDLLREGKINKEEYDYKRKGTILLSKYLYLKIKSIFEDRGNRNVEVKFGKTIIEITPWSLVHILNRHYAKAGKHYDSEKSFHADPNLKFFEEPEELKLILEQLGDVKQIGAIGINFIPFKLNGVLYVVRCEQQVRDNGSIYTRLQTFYPAEEVRDIERIQNEYSEITLTPSLSGFALISP